MQVPTRFTVFPSTQEGDVYGTEFTFTSKFPEAFVSYTWDFGDGEFYYNNSTATHTYNYPGIYIVSLSAWTDEGFLIKDVAEINVDYVYRDAIVVKSLPSEYGLAGLPTEAPFVLELTSAKIDQPIGIVLQSLNTKSVPLESAPTKWRHITPTWRFVDASTQKVIDGAYQVNTTPIYKNSKIVAVSGTASFYYIDDLSTVSDEGKGCPLLIVATLSTQHFTYPPESLHYPYYSYSNSDVTRAFINWQISPAITTDLIVTENYISNTYPIKWTNIPIPVLVTCRFDKNKLGDGFTNIPSGITSGDVISYPKTNEHGSLNTLKLVLSTPSGIIPEDQYTVEVNDVSFSSLSAPLYFQATDEKRDIVSGYVFTTITPLTTINETFVIAASTVTVNGVTSTTGFGFPVGFPIRPHVFISHPKSGTINKITTVSYDEETCENIEYYASSGTLAKGTFETLRTPLLSSFDLSNYTLSGSTAVYGMGFDPILNRLYAPDADDDTIYVFDSTSTLVSSIDIASITGTPYNVPSYVSVDGDHNIWVSLYGGQKLIKFDKDFNMLLAVVPSAYLPASAWFTLSSAGAYGSPFVEPPIVETDSQNDIWACYCHPLSSMLIKYDGTTGNEMVVLNTTAFPVSSVPVSLSIDPLDNVWVACYDSNEIRCYSGVNGSLLYVINNIYHPSYTAFDRNGRLWFTHGYNKMSVRDTVTHEMSSWEIDSATQTLTSVSNVYTPADVHKALMLNEVWGGMIIDVFDTVWAIDSDVNVSYTFTTDSWESYSKIKLFPKPTSNYIVLNDPTVITTIPLSGEIRSAQATGDWCGNKWYQKYGDKYAMHPVYGSSTPFKIYDLNNSFQVTKVNEEFNTSKYFRDLALPELLNNNNELFESFLTAIAGDGIPTKEDIGRIIYERIANFVQTHADFETSEIEQLQSFAKQLSVNVNKYGKEFPSEINRLLNLFSVNKHHLRGQIDYEPDITENIGSVITASDMITANTFIIMKDITRGTYQEVYVSPTDSGATVYPLSSIELEGVKKPFLQNYWFFDYKPLAIGYKNNIINWESDFTTVDYTLSSNEEWYGNDGLVEIMFNNLLTRRLFGD